MEHRRVELDELHVGHGGAGGVCQRDAIAGGADRVCGGPVHVACAASGQNGCGREQVRAGPVGGADAQADRRAVVGVQYLLGMGCIEDSDLGVGQRPRGQ